MPNFRTSYEQQQWNNLDKQASQMFQRLKRGEGTSQDLKTAQSLIEKYSVLASTTFEEGVKAMYALAEAQAAEASKERVAAGGAPFDDTELALYIEEAVNKIVKDEGVELALTVEEIVKTEAKEQDERLGSLIEEKIKALRPERTQIDPEIAARLKDLEDRYGGTTEKVIDTGPTTEVSNTKATSSTSVSPSFEQEVTDAAKDSRDINEDIRDLIEEYSNESERKKEEEDKATIWWRKFKEIGGVKAKVASRLGIGLIAGAVGLIARTVAMELSGAQIWKKIEEVFSDTRLAEMGSAAWEYISRKGKELATWISNQFKSAEEKRDQDAGVKTADTEAVKKLKIKVLQTERVLESGYLNPEQIQIEQENLDRLKRELADAIKESQVAKGKITDENGNPITINAMPSGGSGGSGGGGSQVGTAPTPTPATASTATQTNPVGTTNTEVNNKVDMSQGATTVNQDASIAPPVIKPQPGSEVKSEEVKASGASPQAGGAQSAGLATIPNNSGMSDFLGMYNVGMFAG